MQKKFTSLGLMSGTSGDGVDASVVISDGLTNFKALKNKFYEYDNEIYKNLHSLKYKINNSKDLKIYIKEIQNLEKNYVFSRQSDKRF